MYPLLSSILIFHIVCTVALIFTDGAEKNSICKKKKKTSVIKFKLQKLQYKLSFVGLILYKTWKLGCLKIIQMAKEVSVEEVNSFICFRELMQRNSVANSK